MNHERVKQASTILREAEGGVRVLRNIAWTPSVAADFFARGARELPRVVYPVVDVSSTLEGVASARRLIDREHPAHTWLVRAADAIEGAARMLTGIGTHTFHEHSCSLYGTPGGTLLDGASTPLSLARDLDKRLGALDRIDLGLAPDPVLDAEELAEALRPAVAAHFGADAPLIEVVPELSANALAGPKRIRIRRGARFTPRDVRQLIQHEAYVHVGTSLNGAAQVDLTLLAAGHAATTRTQEGLAVFAELISGNSDPARMRRLADRVIAIQMSMEGADFLDLYRYFLERTGGAREQAFESARRIVRGGRMEGGAPFTKDVVYLDGLVRVHNFLRAVVALHRVDCLRLLFCGKLGLADVPALCHLAADGLIVAPRFVPPWAADPRFLITYLAYSAFLNGVRMADVLEHYREELAGAPLPARPMPPA